MRLCVISDSHASSLQQLPDELVSNLKQADLIVHCGDFTEKKLLDELKLIGNIRAVCGNMDSSDIRNNLPNVDHFEVNGKCIALTHGTGARIGITERIRRMFKDEPDIIIFGHSHQPEVREIERTLMLNPGPARSTFAWLEIEDDVKAEIIEI